MRWKQGSQEPYAKKYTWFAWYPVYLIDTNEYAWLEKVDVLEDVERYGGIIGIISIKDLYYTSKESNST